MTIWRILAVDDEPLNLEILQEYLDDPKYAVQTAEDGAAAWRRLEAATEAPHIVLLDRMMPNMDGMALLRKIKGDARFKDIPVIMQTAASSSDQIREGLEAGAWYYLTKPYGPETLLAIVNAAIYQLDKHAKAMAAVTNIHQALRLATKMEFRFADVEAVNVLAAALSEYCGNPPLMAMGLTELMINAIEHGNLGITYAEKKKLRLSGAWDDEVLRRRKLPDYKDRHAMLNVERGGDGYVIRISDEGAGFDWRRYLEFDPERAFDPNGRGIAMAHKTCFADLEYLGRGNVVVVRVALPK
ncbi:MAG TPA: response regulator [Rhodocyclaceae bacterium]|nr:response regulator [Rhodocyclaceae bacterium]